jgi:hypothetical protein
VLLLGANAARCRRSAQLAETGNIVVAANLFPPDPPAAGEFFPNCLTLWRILNQRGCMIPQTYQAH